MMLTQVDMSRFFYARLREATGCPPIISRRLSKNSYYVETNDGKVHIEQITTVANVWEAKAACILEWQSRNPRMERKAKKG
jgi:hypothetical protein